LYSTVNQFNAAATSSNTHVGFAVGAGFEWALSRNWTMKFEYLYNDLGSENYLSGTLPGGIDADLRFSTGKVGLNYIFDWGRGYIGPKF
jgi:outer membrane immunogenic protein